MALEKLTFTCDNCGEVRSILVDGYTVNDMLEGLMFRVTLCEDNRSVDVELANSERDSKFFEQFNKQKWLEAIGDHVLSDADEEQCAKCESYVMVERIDKELEQEISELLDSTPSAGKHPAKAKKYDLTNLGDMVTRSKRFKNGGGDDAEDAE